MSGVRTVFMGAEPIALKALQTLAEPAFTQTDVVGVYAQPDRPAGRGMKLRPNPVKSWAEKAGLAVRQPEKLSEDDLAWLEEKEVELIVVMAYGHILRRKLIDLPRLGVLNLHASLLPKFRGASPIETAMAAGESETGVCLMRIVPQLDAGPVADREVVPIESEDTPEALRERISQACEPLLHRSIPSVIDGSAVFKEQIHEEATFCRRLTKEDRALDFSRDSDELACRIRALHPWPGSGFPLGEQWIKVAQPAASPEAHNELPGTVLESGNKSLRIACGHGVLELHQLQRPGGKMLAAADFLRGFPIEPGTRIPSGVHRPLWSGQPFPRDF